MRGMLSMLIVAAVVSLGGFVRAEDLTRTPAEVQLELVTKERDALKKQIVELRLEIMNLKEKLQSPSASSTSSGGDAALAEGSNEPTKEWVVTITSFAKGDTKAIEGKVEAEKLVLAGLNKRLDDLAESERANAYSGLYDVTTVTETSRGGFEKTRGVMTQAGIKAGKDAGEIRARTNKEAIESKAKIAKYERELEEARKVRDIDGKLDDDTVVKVKPLSMALGAADAMRVGQKYKIVGSSLKVGGIQKIIMRSAAPVK